MQDDPHADARPNAPVEADNPDALKNGRLRPRKRGRAASRERRVKSKKKTGAEDRFALVSCFDDPDRFVEVDTTLFKNNDCRLSALVRNSTPEVAPCGRHFFRAGSAFTRATLVSFVKSIALGELVVGKDVTLGEMLKVFEFEGIALGGPHAVVAHPPAGIAHAKGREGASKTLATLCERIADALLQWPRLESALCDPCGDLNASSSFSTTTTRAWVRFADAPKSSESTDDRDFAVKVTGKNPRWLVEGLVGLGILHHRLGQSDSAFAKARNEAAFKRLWAAVDDDPLGCFFYIRTDACKSGADAKLKKEIIKGERFYAEVRSTVLQAAESADPTQGTAQFARAVVTLLENTKLQHPNCAKLFSGACADDIGSTPERAALKRALKKRNVSVMRWADCPAARALAFPPLWRDNATVASGPCVLLSFDSLL